MLEQYCFQLYDLNIRYRYLAADGPDYQERSVETERQNIHEATLDRNAKKATGDLIDHYRKIGEYFGGNIKTKTVS